MDKKTIIKEINNSLAALNISTKINDSNINEPFKNLGADSLTLLQIIMKIEEALNITLPDEELINIKTANNLVDLINSKKV